MKQLRVAIVGGGYAGLACALRLGGIAKIIHVYALEEPGHGGASAQSAGLMHPLNKNGAPLWNGDRAYQQSRALMDSLQAHSSASIYKEIAVLRPMFSSMEFSKWKKNSIRFPNMVRMIEGANQYSSISGTNQSRGDETFYGAAWVQCAILVNSKQYLRAMWNQVQKMCDSTEWIVKRVNDLERLSAAYDIVILCCGSGTFETGFLSPQEKIRGSYLPRCHLVKASNLLIPQTDPPLRHAVLRGEYLIPVSVQAGHHIHSPIEYGFNTSDQNNINMLLCGSAQENSYGASSDAFEFQPKLESLRELSLRLKKLHPPLEKYFATLDDSALQALVTTSGVRAMPEKTHVGRLPAIGRHHSLRKNVWYVVGLGARGLIYHDMLSEHVVQAAIQNDAKNIPEELYYKSIHHRY